MYTKEKADGRTHAVANKNGLRERESKGDKKQHNMRHTIVLFFTFVLYAFKSLHTRCKA